MPRRRFHRPVFVLAGAYNLLWGVYAVLDPGMPRLIAAGGLMGKILGPLGLARLLWAGQWPMASAVLCLTNDLIWWFPFALYLHDSYPKFPSKPAT